MKVPISLFVSFISVTGTSRLDKVIQAKQEYEPKSDFYKRLREDVVDVLKGGSIEKLDHLVRNAHEKKASHYAAGVRGLRTFLEEHNIEFLSEPPAVSWTSGELEVRVNPELRIRIDGAIYLVKLHMNQTPLSRLSLQAFDYLVRETHGGEQCTDLPALLDVRNARLFLPPNGTARTGQLIKAEAAAFVAMWYASFAA